MIRNPAGNAECSLCHEALSHSHIDTPNAKDSDSLKATALDCQHVFHKHCIDQWLEKNEDCPLCQMPDNSRFSRSPDPVCGWPDKIISCLILSADCLWEKILDDCYSLAASIPEFYRNIAGTSRRDITQISSSGRDTFV